MGAGKVGCAPPDRRCLANLIRSDRREVDRAGGTVPVRAGRTLSKKIKVPLSSFLYIFLFTRYRVYL